MVRSAHFAADVARRMAEDVTIASVGTVRSFDIRMKALEELTVTRLSEMPERIQAISRRADDVARRMRALEELIDAQLSDMWERMQTKAGSLRDSDVYERTSGVADAALLEAQAASKRIAAVERDLRAMEAQIISERLFERSTFPRGVAQPELDVGTVDAWTIDSGESCVVGGCEIVDLSASCPPEQAHESCADGAGGADFAGAQEEVDNQPKDIDKNVKALVWLELEEEEHEINIEEKEVVRTSMKEDKEEASRAVKTVIGMADEIVPTYSVEESIWDCCLFFNLGLLGPMRSSCIAFSVLSNYFFQAMFLYVADGMGKSDIGDPDLIQQMRNWRLTFGHSTQYASAHSNLPIIAYLCANKGNRGMQMEGNRQVDLYDNIVQYLDERGDILCMLAVSIWIMTIFIELQSIARFTRAIWHGQSRHDRHHLCTKLVTSAEDKARYEFRDFNWQRCVALIIFVSLPRAVIALALGFVGSSFLTATATMGDLILNCMALEVVLNVDELLYTALAPAFIKHVISNLEPMPLGGNHHSAFYRSMPASRLGMLFVLLLTVWFSQVAPALSVMERVRDELCAGSTNFVFRQDLSGEYAVTVGEVDGAEQIIEGGLLPDYRYRHQAVLQATWLWHDSGTVDARYDLERSKEDHAHTGRIFEVDEFFASVNVWRDSESLSLAEFVEKLACADYDSSEPVSPAIREAARQKFGGYNKDGSAIRELPCSAISRWCSAKSSSGTSSSSGVSQGDFARLICPKTCGCDDPARGQLLQGPRYGCPVACSVRLEEALQTSARCEDHSNESAEMLSYIAMFFDEFQGTVNASNELRAWEEGCAFFTSQSATVNWSIGEVSFCDTADAQAIATYGFRSVRTICPSTCGCMPAAELETSGRAASAVLRQLQCPQSCNPYEA